MKNLKLFAQLAKIDEARREVWGIATAEVVDKEGEIFDYESSKPYFKAWSAEIEKATDGKSLGNVREMHAPSAVGKLINITFDDEQRQIQVGANIVDDAAWKKCMDGVYTGFSIGGEYVKAWKDGKFTRFTADPAEISVVDNPCVPMAHFTAVKADGTSEVRKFKVTSAEGNGEATGGAETRASGQRTYKDTASANRARDGQAVQAGNTRGVGKRGAKHSAETRAHHAAIRKALDGIIQSMSEMAGYCQDADQHMDALVEKDDGMEAAARTQMHKDSPATAEIHMGEQPEMLELYDKLQLEKARANSAEALSKIAELEKAVGELKTSQDEIAKSLGNIAKAVSKLAGVDESPTAPAVARTAVPTATVTKADDQRGGEREPSEEEFRKMTPDQRAHYEMVKAFQNPQKIAHTPVYLRTAQSR